MSPTHLRLLARNKSLTPVALSAPAGLSPFPAATHAGMRTNTSFFPLDARRELKSGDWKEILKKSRYLRNAGGLGRALFEKPVKFVCPGGLTPSAATPDEDFNEAADEYFDRWATQPVDVTGTYNFYESIEMIATEMPCDGDFFALKIKGLSNRCQLQFLRAHQIGDSPFALGEMLRNRQPKFTNGIFRNAVGRALAYRVLQDAPTPGSVSWRDYSAEDVLHVFDPSRLSFGRSLPWIYHGANSALDVLDMRALDQVARKLNLMLAGVIKRQGQNGAGLGSKLSPDDLAAITAAANGLPLPAGSEPAAPANANVTWETILQGGAVPILGEGEEFQNISTDRSPTNWIEAAEFLIREIAAGYGVSYEFIWNMAALGGPTARMMLEDLNAFCEKFRRILIGRYCQSVRSWVLANGILWGELTEPKSGNWWDALWSGPPKVTVDRNQAMIYARLLEKGLLTLDEWWSLWGKNAKQMRRKRIREIKEDLLECGKHGVPYSLYCAPAPGTAATDTIGITDLATPGSPAALALVHLLQSGDASVADAIRTALGKAA